MVADGRARAHAGAGNTIGAAGARDLAEALKVNTAVTSIDLRRKSVPAPAGVAGGERGWCAGEGGGGGGPAAAWARVMGRRSGGALMC